MKKSHAELKEEKIEMKLPVPVATTDESRLADAIRALSNTAVRHVTTSSSGSAESMKFDATILGVLKSSFRGPTTYKFRCNKTNYTSSGSSAYQVNIAADLTQYSEGSVLTALFDECKIVRSRLDMALLNTGAFAVMVGCAFYLDTSTPTLTLVGRLPGARPFNCASTTPHLGTLQQTFKGRLWGLTDDEGVGSDKIVSGCNCMWKIAHMDPGGIVSSTKYIGYSLTSIISLRNRG
jgi:hypothetical protein